MERTWTNSRQLMFFFRYPMRHLRAPTLKKHMRPARLQYKTHSLPPRAFGSTSRRRNPRNPESNTQSHPELFYWPKQQTIDPLHHLPGSCQIGLAACGSAHDRPCWSCTLHSAVPPGSKGPRLPEDRDMQQWQFCFQQDRGLVFRSRVSGGIQSNQWLRM